MTDGPFVLAHQTAERLCALMWTVPLLSGAMEPTWGLAPTSSVGRLRVPSGRLGAFLR